MKVDPQRCAQVILLLREEPMTRHDIVRRTGLQQQRVSEILREIGACVIGHEATGRRGHPPPIYAMTPTVTVGASLNLAPLVSAMQWKPI